MTDLRIADLRRDRGWTQEHLAEASGVGVRTIQRLEAGGEGSLETLRRVAAALDVAVPELFASAPLAESPTSDVPRRTARRRAPSERRRAALVVGAVALVGLLVGTATGAARPVTFEASTRAVVSVQQGTPRTLQKRSDFVLETAQADASVAESPIVLTRATSRLGADGRDLQHAVSARVEPGTVVLVISARGASPAVAERRADAVMTSLIDVVPSLTPSGTAGGQRVAQLDSPKTSVDPVWMGGVAGGGGAGLSGGVLVGLILLRFRRRPLPPALVGRVALP